MQIDYSLDSHYWGNYSKEAIIAKILIPFINGHVVLVDHGDTKKILNMKSVSRLTIFKTKKALEHKKDKSIINQIADEKFVKYACTEEIINEAKLLTSAEASSSLIQKSLMETKNQVFVISKFGDNALDSAYEGVIKPLFEEHGIKVIRVDEIQDSGKIDDQILNLIAESKFILSELTGARPNCYYETGFAHALGKEIVLTIKKEDTVHFDLAGYRFIQWETENELRKELKKRVKSLLQDN